ncbi:hypothetical protein V2J09_009114 [Rumex salicifolius]
MQLDQRKKSLKETEFFTDYGDASRYKILEVVGKGSYGVVGAAIDTYTGEKVAIKKINDIFEHTSDAIRILREVKLLRLLKHPDIVEIKRIMLPPSKRDFKDIYVVFELMESDLHQVIKANDDLTCEHHQFFLYQMLRALKYIHTANVYHRDLKPKNILANANCKLKICDFGLARVAFSDTPTTVFWTDYVATRWYRAPELCGSFFTKYTPAIDVWSIGCVFAEVLTGQPLFPGKSVIHQLDLITNLLGTPSSEIISWVRNDKARKYLMDMRKKNPVPFSQKFPNVDPLALRLLERMLSFDPRHRPTAEEALADPYFRGLAKAEREPASQQISKLEFEFERLCLTKEDIRELIYREILEHHPQLLKDYISGNEGVNFVYPSAIGQFKRQFAHLEENNGRSGPVIPLERKHISLPRSTVLSSAIPLKPQPNHCSLREQFKKEVKSADVASGIYSICSQLPQRVPSGRLVDSLTTKVSYDPRIVMRNPVIPPQSISPYYLFRPATTQNQVKSNVINADKATIQESTVGRNKHETVIDINTSPYPSCQHHYHQPGPMPSPFNSRIALNATLIQAQSQFGAVRATAVSMGAHRNLGTVYYGMS